MGRPSNGMSTLEKVLIVVFVVMTSACIALVVVYFVEEAQPSTQPEGERSRSKCARATLQYISVPTSAQCGENTALLFFNVHLCPVQYFYSKCFCQKYGLKKVWVRPCPLLTSFSGVNYPLVWLHGIETMYYRIDGQSIHERVCGASPAV